METSDSKEPTSITTENMEERISALKEELAAYEAMQI